MKGSEPLISLAYPLLGLDFETDRGKKVAPTLTSPKLYEVRPPCPNHEDMIFQRLRDGDEDLAIFMEETKRVKGGLGFAGVDVDYQEGRGEMKKLLGFQPWRPVRGRRAMSPLGFGVINATDCDEQ